MGSGMVSKIQPYTVSDREDIGDLYCNCVNLVGLVAMFVI